MLTEKQLVVQKSHETFCCPPCFHAGEMPELHCRINGRQRLNATFNTSSGKHHSEKLVFPMRP